MKKLSKDEKRKILTGLFHIESTWQNRPLCEDPGPDFMEKLSEMLYESGESLGENKTITVDLIRQHLAFLLRAPNFIQGSQNEDIKERLQRSLDRLQAEGY